MSSTQTFAIVGASLAGAKAAETLREAGFDGRVLLLGAERERPYERPPLSKDYVRGDSPREKVYVHPAGFYNEHGSELRTSTPVQAIDTAARELALGSGERVHFDRLLLTTGAEPRRLRMPGSDLDEVFYLRDLSDADAIAERIARGGGLRGKRGHRTSAHRRWEHDRLRLRGRGDRGRPADGAGRGGRDRG